MSLFFASRVKDSNQPLNFNFRTVFLLEIAQKVISVLFNSIVTDITILHCLITFSFVESHGKFIKQNNSNIARVK